MQGISFTHFIQDMLVVNFTQVNTVMIIMTDRLKASFCFIMCSSFRHKPVIVFTERSVASLVDP